MNSQSENRKSCYYSEVNSFCQCANSLITLSASVLSLDILTQPACRQTASVTIRGKAALRSELNPGYHDALDK